MKKRSVSRARRDEGQPLWVIILVTAILVGFVYLLSIPSGDQIQGNSGFFRLK